MKLHIILSESHRCILDPRALSHIPWPLEKLLPYHFSELLAYFFTYLSGPCPSCGMQDPQSLLWHMGSSVTGAAACKLLVVACRIQLPEEGSHLLTHIGSAESWSQGNQGIL